MGSKYLLQAIILAGLTLTGSALGKPDAEPVAAKADDNRAAGELAGQCASLTCRASIRHFSLRGADGKAVEGETARFPYVNDKGAVLVFPQEKVSISLARQGDGLALPVFVTATDPGGTTAEKRPGIAPANFSFELRQLDRVPGTVLLITNRLNAVVKFDLLIYVPVAGGMRAVHTSSCPVLPPQNGLKAFTGVEQWPQPVMMVAIADMHILPPGAPTVCE